MKFRMCIVLAIPMLVAAVPSGDMPQLAESLTGTWEVVNFERDNGTPIGLSFRVYITSSQMIWDDGDRFQYSTDPVSGSIDMVHASDAVLLKTLRGIYQLKGDRLTICWSRIRPRNIVKNGHRFQPVYVLVRVSTSATIPPDAIRKPWFR